MRVSACPTCRSSLTYGDELAGQVIACPNCREEFLAPRGARAEDPESPALFPSLKPPPATVSAPPREGRFAAMTPAQRTMLAASVVFGLIGLLLAGFAIRNFAARRGAPEVAAETSQPVQSAVSPTEEEFSDPPERLPNNISVSRREHFPRREERGGREPSLKPSDPYIRRVAEKIMRTGFPDQFAEFGHEVQIEEWPFLSERYAYKVSGRFRGEGERKFRPYWIGLWYYPADREWKVQLFYFDERSLDEATITAFFERLEGITFE